jgi:hypothetical protein
MSPQLSQNWTSKKRRPVSAFLRHGVEMASLAITVSQLLTSCGPDPKPTEAMTIIVDRTGVAQAESWSAEVAVQTQQALKAAVDDGVDLVDIISIGSNTDQTATVASADFSSVEGNTEAKRDAARQSLVDQLVSATAQVAAQPVETSGSDVFAALDQAASLCAAAEVAQCSLLVISDLEDQRVLTASSPEATIEELGPLMPDLTGVSVQVSGLGASGAEAATVQKVKAAWTGLLDQAGAVDIRIARSL